jgi:hypothetical protein
VDNLIWSHLGPVTGPVLTLVKYVCFLENVVSVVVNVVSVVGNVYLLL